MRTRFLFATLTSHGRLAAFLPALLICLSRIFVTVFDGNQHAAYGNVAFLVTD